VIAVVIALIGVVVMTCGGAGGGDGITPRRGG
jgi:hypothetical protein